MVRALNPNPCECSPSCIRDAGMQSWSPITSGWPREGAPERRIPILWMTVDGGITLRSVTGSTPAFTPTRLRASRGCCILGSSSWKGLAGSCAPATHSSPRWQLLMDRAEKAREAFTAEGVPL